MAHPERFELPTDRFVADYSIQLSYGCAVRTLDTTFRSYAPLAGEYLQPLGHLSVTVWRHYPSFGDPCQLFFTKLCANLKGLAA